MAVLAQNTWAAFEGKKALKITWDMGKNGTKSSADILKELAEDYATESKVNVDLDKATSLFRSNKKVFSAVYDASFQANACMEPLNATAYHRGHKVEIWAGTQAPKLTRDRIAELTGLPLAAVTVNNPPSGGGFGRRYFCDFVEEAVILSEKLRQPVKVTWSREDTFLTSKFNPITRDYWQASLGENNYPTAIKYRGTVSRPSGFRCYPYSIPMGLLSLFKIQGKLVIAPSFLAQRLRTSVGFGSREFYG